MPPMGVMVAREGSEHGRKWLGFSGVWKGWKSVTPGGYPAIRRRNSAENGVGLRSYTMGRGANYQYAGIAGGDAELSPASIEEML
jgi:hypothetical protein